MTTPTRKCAIKKKNCAVYAIKSDKKRRYAKRIRRVCLVARCNKKLTVKKGNNYPVPEGVGVVFALRSPQNKQKP